VKATKVNAGLAESNGRLLLGIWRDSLHVTCGLTACTPGSAQRSVTSMGKLYLLPYSPFALSHSSRKGPELCRTRSCVFESSLLKYFDFPLDFVLQSTRFGTQANVSIRAYWALQCKTR